MGRPRRRRWRSSAPGISLWATRLASVVVHCCGVSIVGSSAPSIYVAPCRLSCLQSEFCRLRRCGRGGALKAHASEMELAFQEELGANQEMHGSISSAPLAALRRTAIALLSAGRNPGSSIGRGVALVEFCCGSWGRAFEHPRVDACGSFWAHTKQRYFKQKRFACIMMGRRCEHVATCRRDVAGRAPHARHDSGCVPESPEPNLL